VQLAREIPWIMKNYQLEEITTRPVLRRQLADHFRRVKTDNPKVIDVLLFKGQAEAHEVLAHYTQRHHLVRHRPPITRLRKRACSETQAGHCAQLRALTLGPARRSRAMWRRARRRRRRRRTRRQGRSSGPASSPSALQRMPAQLRERPATDRCSRLQVPVV
jgi:hypothetical protein